MMKIAGVSCAGGGAKERLAKGRKNMAEVACLTPL